MTRERRPDAVVQRFLRTMHRLDLAGTRVGVAFSAGPDSCALAICSAEARQAIGLEPTLLHIDHNQRSDSDYEHERADAIAAELQLPIRHHALDLQPGRSEDVLRRERYSALARLMRESGCTVLMTGHHADDQAETLLLNLVRGAGLTGARAMREMRPLSLFDHECAQLVRPMLFERRADLAALVTDRGIKPVIDETNADLSYRRNLIRHQVLPVLETVNKGAAIHLARFSQLLTEDADFLDHLAEEALTAVDHDGSGWALPVKALASQPEPISRRMLRHWILQATGIVPTFERTTALADLAMRGSGGACIELGGGWSVSRCGGDLLLRAQGELDGCNDEDA